MDFGTSDVPLTSAEKEKVVSVAVIEWPLPFFFSLVHFFLCVFSACLSISFSFVFLFSLFLSSYFAVPPPRSRPRPLHVRDKRKTKKTKLKNPVESLACQLPTRIYKETQFEKKKTNLKPLG